MAGSCQIVQKQDLPPLGGYRPIPYKRIPAKRLLSGPALFIGYIGVTVGSMYLYYLNKQKVDKRKIEMRSSKMAIYPMLVAERDREYLKQLRRNREAEAELMKDVPDWEVGTYYGERVYKLVEPDALVEPIFQEYYAHASDKAFNDRANIKLWS